MNNRNFVEEGLRDNDVFELFLDLLNNEKGPEKLIYLDFDSVIKDIGLIKSELDYLLYAEDDKRIYDPVHPINAEKIEYDIYSKYIRDNYEMTSDLLEDLFLFSGNEHLISKNRKYLEFLNDNKDYVELELQKIYNSYLKNSIVLILEKYLNFFETFGFVRDSYFNRLFSEYIEYMLDIVNITKDYNFIKRYKISTALFSIVKPFFEFTFNDENETVMSISGVAVDLSSQFKRIKNGDILYLTREINKEQIHNTEIIPYDTTDQLFFAEKYYEHWLEYNMEITVDSTKKSDMFFSMYLIMQSFENIKGISYGIYDVRIGSLSSKIKVKAKDIVAKEEFKTVLRNGAAIAANRIDDTSFPKIEKSHEEDKKAEIKVEEIQKKLDSSLSANDLKYENSLSVNRDDLENKRLEAELKILQREEELKALEVKIKEIEYIDRLSQLLASGIVQVDFLNVTLDGLPIIIKTGGQLEIGDIDGAIV